MEYTNSRMRELILEYVHSQRDRKILYRRLIDDITFAEMSREFHLSEDQLKKIVYREQKVLFRHLNDTGQARKQHE